MSLTRHLKPFLQAEMNASDERKYKIMNPKITMLSMMAKLEQIVALSFTVGDLIVSLDEETVKRGKTLYFLLHDELENFQSDYSKTVSKLEKADELLSDCEIHSLIKKLINFPEPEV